MNQGLAFSIWLGTALLALIWANLHLWRTRRVLKHLRMNPSPETSRLENPSVPQAQHIPATAAMMAGSVTAP